MKSPERTALLFKLISLLLLLLAACSGSEGGQGGPPPTSVVVAPVVQRDVTEAVSVVGSIVADEIVEIQSEIEGVVEKIAFEEGTRVEQGDLLFQIDAVKLSSEVAEAEANFRLAEANLKRAEELLKSKTISSKEYDQAISTYRATQATLERAKQRLDDAHLRAPFAGIVGARLVSAGQRVSVGQTLTSIVNLATVKAEFSVPGRYLGDLAEGAGVRLRVDAYPDEVFDGKIFFISPRVDPATRTVLVKARVNNENRKLIHGMLAAVDVGISSRPNALLIPETAVIQRRDQQAVFVVADGDMAELRPVKTGLRLKGEVEILEGLSQGELVITEGTQKIGPGSPVSYKRAETAKSAQESA